MHKYVNTTDEIGAPKNHPTRVAVLGGRGYVGLELIQILKRHPCVEIAAVYATRGFDLFAEVVDPSLKSVPCLGMELDKLDSIPADIYFLATPPEVSLEMVPLLLNLGKKVIDLSGAFRLKTHATADWYGFENPHAEILKNAVYGLQPFCKREISGLGPVGLISNPGCYATGVSLLLTPILRSQTVQVHTLSVDAKSGTTGAGRKAQESQIFSEVDGECLPYRIGRHQHTPEIQEALFSTTGISVDLMWTTSLLPTRRGIQITAQARLNSDLSPEAAEQKFLASLQETFNGEASEKIIWGKASERPELLSLRRVVGRPGLHLAYEFYNGRAAFFAVMDNLLLGAASQAVENLNQWMNWPRDLGLKDMRGLV